VVLPSVCAQTGFPLWVNETIEASLSRDLQPTRTGLQSRFVKCRCRWKLSTPFQFGDRARSSSGSVPELAAKRWRPGLVGPGDADARHLCIDQVRLAVRGGFLCTPERGAELSRRARDLTLHAEALGDGRHVHVRAAEI